MYVRLVSGVILPGKFDEAVELWWAVVLPGVQEQPGFRGVRLLVNREAGKITTMGLWEHKSNFQRTVGWNQGQIDKFAALFAAPPSVDGYDLEYELFV